MQSAPQRQTILLAEDEVLVRNLLHSVLTQEGYDVITGANGAEALRLSETFEGEIDLLLSDVRMPLMDGLELADRVKQARPAIKIFLMSGRLSGELVLASRTTNFIRKPFLPKALLERIRSLLEIPSREYPEASA